MLNLLIIVTSKVIKFCILYLIIFFVLWYGKISCVWDWMNIWLIVEFARILSRYIDVGIKLCCACVNVSLVASSQTWAASQIPFLILDFFRNSCTDLFPLHASKKISYKIHFVIAFQTTQTPWSKDCVKEIQLGGKHSIITLCSVNRFGAT